MSVEGRCRAAGDIFLKDTYRKRTFTIYSRCRFSVKFLLHILVIGVFADVVFRNDAVIKLKTAVFIDIFTECIYLHG